MVALFGRCYVAVVDARQGYTAGAVLKCDRLLSMAQWLRMVGKV